MKKPRRPAWGSEHLRALRWFGFGLPALLLAALLAPLAAQQISASMLTVESAAPYRYRVSLPAGCRQEQGPGTLDAICSAEFDAEKSAEASAAASLVFEVGAETVAGDADKAASQLAAGYGEDAFRGELPEAVCGESDKARVKIGNVKEVVEETRVVYTAEVVCAEVKFLQVGERRALVRHVIAPGGRYRLVARALAEDFDRQRETIDAFFASFRVLPAAR